MSKEYTAEAVTEDLSEFDAAFDEITAAAGADDEQDGDAPAIDSVEVEDDEEKAFAEAFTDAAGGEPAAQEGDEPEADDDDLAKKLEKTEAENEKLRQSERSQRGRVSALTKKLVEIQAAKKPPEKGGDQAKDDNADDDDGDAEWEEFAEEFPEMARIVEKRLNGMKSKVDRIGKTVSDVSTTTDTLAEKEVEAYMAEQGDILMDRHKDLAEVMASPEYAQFIQSADDDIRTKLKSPHADDAISIIDSFKEKTGWKSAGTNQAGGKSEIEKLKERRAKNLQGSAGISSKKVGHTPRAETDSGDDFDSAFEEAARKKEKQRERHR